MKSDLPEFVNEAGKPKKWVYAIVALDRFMQVRGDPSDAQAALIASLALGRIRTRARYQWISSHKFLNKAWSDRPDDAVEKKMLKKKFWKPLKGRLEDRALWRWKASSFHTTVSGGRRMMQGVQLRVEDLQKLFPDVYGPSIKTRKPGPNLDLNKIHLAWKTVLELALDQQEPWRSLSKQGDLQDEIYEKANTGNSEVGAGKAQQVARVAWPLFEKKLNAPRPNYDT